MESERLSQKQITGHVEEYLMNPEPEYMPFYPGVQKFKDKVVLISFGDSGIGRAVALAFANEGAAIAIIYKDDHKDAALTKQLVENFGSTCLLLPGDVGDKNFCIMAVQETVEALGKIDVLINNAGEQLIEDNFEKISEQQLLSTFRTNVFSNFFLIQAALPHIPYNSGNIINNASAKSSNFSATKGATVALTYSLSQELLKRGIRVNAVLSDVGNPNEYAGAFTWLASLEASYVNGLVLNAKGSSF